MAVVELAGSGETDWVSIVFGGLSDCATKVDKKEFLLILVFF